QNTGQAFMDAKYTLQARHLAFAASPILEIGKLDQRGGPVPKTVELGLLGKFGELLLRAACCRREAVLQEHENRFRRGERACRKEPSDEGGIGPDIDGRLHDLQPIDQRFHDLIRGLSDVFGGRDHVEIGIINDRDQLLSDLGVDFLQGIESRLKSVVERGSLSYRGFERLEVGIQPPRDRLDRVQGRASAALPQAIEDRRQCSVALLNYGCDCLLLVRIFGGNEARGRGGYLSRRGR